MSEDEGDEDDEDDEESSTAQPKASLGKRKAAALPPKPTRKRPDKKSKSELLPSIPKVFAQYLRLGGPRVEVEYEQEMESIPLTKSALANW